MQAERYRGTSLIKSFPSLGPYGRTMPRDLWKPQGGGLFLMSEELFFWSVCKPELQQPEAERSSDRSLRILVHLVMHVSG